MNYTRKIYKRVPREEIVEILDPVLSAKIEGFHEGQRVAQQNQEALMRENEALQQLVTEMANYIDELEEENESLHALVQLANFIIHIL